MPTLTVCAGWVVLAQAQAQQGGKPAPSLLQWLAANPYLFLVSLFVLFYVIFIAPERRKQAEANAVWTKLKVNDRVVTFGGIFGTIVNIQKNSNEVTLRIDEGTNAKLRVLRNSISHVVDGKSESIEKDGK